MRNDAVFPYTSETEKTYGQPGLTKRELAAILLCANSLVLDGRNRVKAAVEEADALFDELEK